MSPECCLHNRLQMNGCKTKPECSLTSSRVELNCCLFQRLNQQSRTHFLSLTINELLLLQQNICIFSCFWCIKLMFKFGYYDTLCYSTLCCHSNNKASSSTFSSRHLPLLTWVVKALHEKLLLLLLIWYKDGAQKSDLLSWNNLVLGIWI